MSSVALLRSVDGAFGGERAAAAIFGASNAAEAHEVDPSVHALAALERMRRALAGSGGSQLVAVSSRMTVLSSVGTENGDEEQEDLEAGDDEEGSDETLGAHAALLPLSLFLVRPAAGRRARDALEAAARCAATTPAPTCVCVWQNARDGLCVRIWRRRFGPFRRRRCASAVRGSRRGRSGVG